jgi:hypothetical protein
MFTINAVKLDGCNLRQSATITRNAMFTINAHLLLHGVVTIITLVCTTTNTHQMRRVSGA